LAFWVATTAHGAAPAAKGTLYAAKAIALMGLDLLEDGGLRARAKEAFRCNRPLTTVAAPTLAEAAKLLHVDVSRVRQRLRERSLFGIEHEGSWRLPRFQFERRLVIPGLTQILKALPPDLFPLDVVDWFLLPDSDLQLDSDTAPLSPRKWLLSGRPVDAVVTLAADTKLARIYFAGGPHPSRWN
jgi:hypothetical protein